MQDTAQQYQQVYNAFEQACLDGDLEKVKLLRPENINYCIDPKQSFDGETPLILAIFKSHFEVVKYLLEEGADANLQNEVAHDLPLDLMFDGVENITPLGWAAAYSSLEILEILLQYGAKVNVMTGRGWTPLKSTLGKYGSFPKMQCLLNHGADPNLYKHEWNVFGPYSLPLSSVVGSGHLESIQAIIAAGADVNATNHQGETALFSWNGQPEILELLISTGINLLAMNRDGETALAEAERRKDMKKVELLKSKMQQ